MLIFYLMGMECYIITQKMIKMLWFNILFITEKMRLTVVDLL